MPGFTGHVADAETGLSYLQARYYDPYAGRFLAVDPVEASAGSFNRYWYANNNPYRFVDPDGRQGLAFAGWTNSQIHMPPEQAAVFANIVADFTPIVGDIKGIVEAIQDPTPANIAGAAIGLVPLVGDYLGRGIKITANATENVVSSPVLKAGMGSDVRPMSLVREIQKGEKISDIVNEGSRLTFLDDLEHAVVSMHDGRRLLVSGGRHGIELSGDVRRVIGHSHPWSLRSSGPSEGDLDAIRDLGQWHSYLLERGELTRFPK